MNLIQNFKNPLRPKVTVWQLYDSVSKTRITYGGFALCVLEKNKYPLSRRKEMKIIPNI